MSFARFLTSLALLVLVAGCATFQPKKSGPNLVLEKLQAMNISSSTYAKIANGRVLSFDDILGLVKKSVPGPVIYTYIRATKAPYTLTDDQLDQLVNAGANSQLVNYLGQSVGFFEATERNQTGGAGKWKDNPYFADPYYLGDAPFGFGYPGEWFDDDWVGGVF